MAYVTLATAVCEWNTANHSRPITPTEYRSKADLRAAGIGRTIFATYNEETGWKLKHVGLGMDCLARVVKVLRQCCILRALFGLSTSVLNTAQKDEFRAVFYRGGDASVSGSLI